MTSHRIHAINHETSTFRCHFFPRRALDIRKVLGARLMKLKELKQKVQIKMHVCFDIVSSPSQ